MGTSGVAFRGCPHKGQRSPRIPLASMPPQPGGPVLRCFSFNDPATTEIYTLSLHDALPIFLPHDGGPDNDSAQMGPPSKSSAKPIQFRRSWTCSFPTKRINH